MPYKINAITGKLDRVLGDHSELDQLNWSVAGHIFDEDVTFGDFDIDDVGDIALDSISSDSDTSVIVNLGTDPGDDFIAGNNNAFRVTGDTDRIGIGKIVPTAQLDVEKLAVTDISGNVESIQQKLTARAGSASSAIYTALDTRVETLGIENYTGALKGIAASFAHSGTGTLAGITGNDFSVINVNGNLSGAIGYKTFIRNLGTGTLSTAIGFDASAPQVTAGTILTYYAFRARNPVAANTNFAFYSDGGACEFNAGGATVDVVTIDGAAGQSGSLLRLRDSNGNPYIDSGDGLTSSEFVGNDQGLNIPFRWEGTTEDKLFMVVPASDEVRLGDGDTNYLVTNKIGDTWWVGSGTGVPYGHMYVDGTQSIIVALTQNTPAEVKDDGTTSVDDGWLAGDLNQMTFPTGGTEHYIAIAKPGVHHITWSLSFHMVTGAANTQIHGGLAIDGTPIEDKCEVHRTISNATDTGNVASSCLVDLPNGTEQLSIWIKNTTNNNDVEVHHGSLTAVMVGGT